MRPLSHVLQDLLIVAEAVVARPVGHGMVLRERVERFAQLAAEVRRHDALPAEEARATCGGVGLALSIEQHWRAVEARNELLATLWLAGVGVLMPIVRTEAFIAMTNERGVRRP